VIAQTRAELLKIRSTRTTLGLLLGMIGLALLFALLTGLLSKTGHLTAKEDQRGLLGNGSLAGVFAALAGIMLVTSEYRFGTIRPTLLYTPQRVRVIAAKLVAGVLAGLAFGVIGEGLVFGIGYGILAGRGIIVSLNGGEITLLVLGTLAAVALWGAIGVGLGAVVRNQVGAVIALLAWGFVVENLLFAFVPSVGRFAPVHAQNALIGLTTTHLLAPAAGGAALIGWTLALALAGVILTRRRDVS
jgi:ABC-2 type transport system permease protein